MPSLLEGAAFFTGVAVKIENGRKTALTKAARIIKKEAKRVLGTYDYDWPRLAEATIANKKTGDSPLLETGAMRSSITYSIDVEEGIATIGSNDPKALWQELGTSRGIPPRSFLAGAAMHKEEEVKEVLGKKLFSHSFSAHATDDFEDAWSYDGED
jgi:phage gpG-like protein